MISLRRHFGGFGNRLFQLAYLYAKVRKTEIPDIYLQDDSYWKEFSEEIRYIYSEGIKPSDSVSLHVRRGDYIGNEFYVNLCNTDYYEKALTLFPGENFLVFCADRQGEENDSSDMAWCRDRFVGEQFSFSKGKDEIEDFNLMAGCKAHIIANSSFSWWAAYVGGGKTVCPEKWFSDGVKRISLPEEWIKL